MDQVRDVDENAATGNSMVILRYLYRYRWLLVFLFFGACVALKINASSVGMWEEITGEKDSKGLILFKPRPIRTDEWLVWTPAVFSQARQIPPFPTENPSLGAGRAPLLLNLPVASYTTWFRPQLWGFFVFDFERGYSFCWCVKILALLLGPVWLLRQFGIRSGGLALFAGASIFLSLQWWITSPAMLPEIFGSWAVCAASATQLFTQTNRWRLAIAFGAFVYCGVNFVLCSYPPAEIPLLYLAPALIAGFAVERRRAGELCQTTRGILLLGMAIVAVVLILVPCFINLRPTLELVSQTMYPGARRNSGGALSIFKLFSGLGSFFQTENSIPRAFTNVTLPSHTFPVWPLVIAVMIIARYRRKIPMPPLLVALSVALLCLHVYCLIPLPGWLARASLLAFSTPFSTQFAIGPGSILLTALFLDRYRGRVLTNREASVALAVSLSAMALLFYTAGFRKPDFFPVPHQVVLSLAASALLLGLFLFERRRLWFPVTLVALLLLSLGNINPVMRGLPPLLKSEAFQTVDKIRQADPEAKWIVYESLALPELVRATGARVVNGFKIVPDLEFVHRFDPVGHYNFVYNRYGHLICRLPEYPGQVEFQFVAADYYMLFLSPGDSELRRSGCRYLVLPSIWPEADLHGFSLLAEVPNGRLYVYKQE